MGHNLSVWRVFACQCRSFPADGEDTSLPFAAGAAAFEGVMATMFHMAVFREDEREWWYE